MSKPRYAQPSILPKPRSVTLKEIYASHLEHVKISTCVDMSMLYVFIQTLQSEIPCKLQIYDSPFDTTMAKEGYSLSIQPDGVGIIISNDLAGLWHARGTLLQIMSQKGKDGLPVCTILDAPRFQHRGLLLDCSRHFLSVPFIIKYINILSILKMNVLHWHLTDDQGWRIQIDKYPKLTEIGAYRMQNNERYGGYYSKEDMKKVVNYARERGILVIPEIEMPGHSLAALASYPHLGCFIEKQYLVETNWGVFHDVFCAGKDSTFEFIQDVLEEVLEIFDSPYIHIGGDECLKDCWRKCTNCQTRILNENLQNEEELQSYFIKRIGTWLNSKDMILIGWDEIMEGGLDKRAIVQCWRGVSEGIKALKSSSKVIMSPTSHCYFDYSIKTTNLQKVYSFDPIPSDLDENLKHLVIGGECNMWSERAPEDQIDQKLFPRILAMSECLWSDKKDDFDVFENRISFMETLLEKLEVKTGPSGVDLMKIELETVNQEFFVILKSRHSDIKVMYSLDNQEFVEYLGPIPLKSKITIFAYGVKNGKKLGDLVEKTFNYNLTIHKDILVLPIPSPSYPGISLVNGQAASLNFRDPQWMGFLGKDVEMVIDIKDSVHVDSVGVYCLNDPVSWIFTPRAIRVSISQDSKDWKDLDTLKIVETKTIQIDVLKIKVCETTRLVKVNLENYGSLPKWHGGSGKPSWTFISQVVIE